MASSSNGSTRSVLLVSDSGDESVRRLSAAIDPTVVALETIPDVYSAMSRLSRDTDAILVLVDTRSLDEKELAFLNLAPRYYPHAEFIVPLFDGAADRLASMGGPLRTASMTALIASLNQPTAVAAAGTVAELPPYFDEEGADLPLAREATGEAITDDSPFAAPAPLMRDTSPPSPPPAVAPRPLSTDGRPEDATPEPSLHEAVRRRMAGNDPRTVRRQPPPRSAPTPPSPSSLTPEELDALLDVGDLTLDADDPSPREGQS